MRWALLAVPAASVARAAKPPALGMENIGWAFANRISATKGYKPDPAHSYNSAGGSIDIVPLAKGSYRVDFARLYNSGPSHDMQVNGALQVSAVRTNGYCTANRLGAHKHTLQAYVTCFNARGKPANSRFTVLFQLRDMALGNASTGLAYFWANAVGAGYDPYYQYDSAGGKIEVTAYDGAGTFTAFIPGLTAMGGDVQAVAFNYAGPARCKADGWGTSASGTNVKVLCVDEKGNPAYAIFYLTYALNVPFGTSVSATSNGAYAWANEPTNVDLYTPDATYQYNGFGTGSLTAQRTDIGRYTITIPGTISYNSSIAFVTANTYDQDQFERDSYCNIVDWGVQTIDVACYGRTGYPTDAYFDVAFQTAG